ncbi:hypothetical protein LDENG_00020620 [Lucifuga dentata]|nr:hypothetical protein LDENG_00020620 [Lucifuga dentata]
MTQSHSGWQTRFFSSTPRQVSLKLTTPLSQVNSHSGGRETFTLTSSDRQKQSYVIHTFGEKEVAQETPAKQASAGKKDGLKEVMKASQFKPLPKTPREPSPDPSTEETGSEKEPSTETTKQEKQAEAKQEKGNFFSGILKKSQKPADETPEKENLSASNDSLSENSNTKEKGGIFGGIFKKPPKPPEAAQTDEDQQSLHSDLSASKENLSENSKEKGGFFSGILRKTPKPPREETPGQDEESLQTELSASNDKLSENNTKEKVGMFSGMFKKSPKLPEEPQLEEDESQQNKRSASDESLSENNKEKGGLFSGILKKTPKASGEQMESQDRDTQKEKSASNDDLSENNTTKEKNIFSNMFKKPQKASDGAAADKDKESLHGELSASNDSLSENEEKGGLFNRLLRKTPKAAEEEQENLSAQKDLSTSSDSLSEAASNKEKGSAFSGMLRRTFRLADETPTEEEKQSLDHKLSVSNDSLSEENDTKEKGGIFSGIFKKSHKPAQPEEDESLNNELSTSNESLSENKKEKGGLFSGLLKKTPKPPGERTESPERDAEKETSASNDNLSENNTTKEKNIFSNMFKKPQKPAEGATAEKDLEMSHEKQKSGSCENLDTTVQKEKKGGLAGIFKRSASIDNLFENEEKGGLFSGLLKKTPKASGDEAAAEDKDTEKELSGNNNNLTENTKEKNIFSGMFKKAQKPAEGTTADEESNTGGDKKLSSSCENLSVETTLKEKTGGLTGIFKKPPKPAPRSVATKDPLSDAKYPTGSCDSLTDIGMDDLTAGGELSASNDNLSEAATATKEKKGGFAGMFRRTPKPVEQQESENTETPLVGGLKRRRTIKKKRRVVSFRVKQTLPRIPEIGLSSQSSDKLPAIGEAVELQELNSAQESTVEVQPVEMAAYPTDGNPLESEEENDGLLDWWKTVEGWSEWNEAANFKEEDEEVAMEQAADRVYMAARLFVHLFNKRGATLQQHILELLAVADAADQFHKKTVQAAVGGGVASIAGSVATITGLILAPFTFGASIIVTAVGISVATAGSITSATANITDTVHSNMDRKKVEKMIQGYQEEINDIRECLEFVQEGMDTLQEWDFEKYSQSAAKKAMNHNIKHVMTEGGLAGKALMINTNKLISTVQVLGAAGGVAKAAQAISVTTGVMSALFLALDVFFLAKDSHELRKGAKTKFATKVREVCKDLQDGLLELNKVKTQLQKTMDGIELEEYEEIEEVEVEVEDDLESDPKKLAELEQELDLLEEKLDKKVEEEQKSKEMEKNLEHKEGKEKESVKDKGVQEGMTDKNEKEEETEEKSTKKEGKKESKKEKGEVESNFESNLEKIPDEQHQNENRKAEETTKQESGSSDEEGAFKQRVEEQGRKGGVALKEEFTSERVAPAWRNKKASLRQGVEGGEGRRETREQD